MPYELVYGNQVLLPIEFQIKTFKKNNQAWDRSFRGTTTYVVTIE